MLRLAPRALFAAWLGLAVYCLLSVLLGPGGLLAAQSISSTIDAMRSNIADLSEVNAELSADIASLQSDPDRIRLEARPLGWLAKGETEIVILGRPEKIDRRLSAGKILPVGGAVGISDAAIKTASLSLAFFGFILGLLRSPSEKKARKRSRRAKGGPGSEGGRIELSGKAKSANSLAS